MTFDLPTNHTSYIVVANKEHHNLTSIRRRLAAASGADTLDPFMLHSLITHQTLLDAGTVITPLRHNLYDQLDLVDDYSSKPAQQRGKAELDEITIKLHVVSQDLDSMVASAEMTGMIVRRLVDAHERYRNCLLGSTRLANASTKTHDGLRYLQESVESQKRWLASYRSRKDIAFNLVGRRASELPSVRQVPMADMTMLGLESCDARQCRYQHDDRAGDKVR